MRGKYSKILLPLIMAAVLLAGCQSAGDGPEDGGQKKDRDSGPYSAVNGSYAGVDDLGRALPGDQEASAVKSDKKVGIFYFLWQGEHETLGPYDNNKIVAENPDAILSEKNWIKAGGGARGKHHFWGEPLFGYYTSRDTWVMRKHVQMLTDAGVDFIVFDTTNGYTYSSRVIELISVWYEYLTAGWNVPKLAFYTNSSSGKTMNTIYDDIYQNKKLREKYPRLDELWFYLDGKPMIVGIESDAELRSEVKDHFRIKASQWPTEGYKEDGFPWMEFGRSLTEESVYGLNGKKEVMNVSIAQHSSTVRFSATAWYGANDRTRSWHDGANDTSENAILHGYNFAEQWEYAIAQDPEMIFITGWNEWVAQRQAPNSSEAIVFVDCADPNNSRDAEPMRGLFGDNYYMQMCSYIRKFKGTESRVDIGDPITIDINGSFDQWNNEAITARYLDYQNDTVDRDARGFGRERYVNETGRNDFVNMKVTYDKDYLYFYVDTAAEITSSADPHWMTLFLKSGRTDTENWYGYDFALNLTAPSGTEAVLSKCTGDWSWAEAGKVRFKTEGNQMMAAIPRDLLGIPDDNGSCVLDIEFKWADNYQGEGDIWSFYTDGDAAPYGRLNYVFSEKVK